ncbi:MAG TPA: class I SAM-dependent methyltransferase [Pyrinomonadaceae bacterium]|nr:class I SAM-dependent methyltransferase [Pyrinomonadaceae bacterium]
MGDQYDETTYGERVAEIYDELYPKAPTEMIEALKDLAADGPVLELGIGTGRIALPLAAQGVEVHGVEASEAMAARLRSKPGGDGITVTVGNFAGGGAGGGYSLVFVAFNTFFLLGSQEEQVLCFANVSKRLRPGGLFLVEAFVPDPTRFTRGQTTQAIQVGVDDVRLEVSRHDPLNQRTHSQFVLITEAGVKLYPIQMRYAWPSELDLMARLAGMRLRERWGDWRRAPFTAASTNHISVYELP